MITKMVPQIDIFVSSPGDLMDERGAVQHVVERLNRITFRDECLLVPARFEVHVPPEIGDKAQFIVNNYMKVQNSHILICMLWSRMGTPFTDPKTGTRYESGTYYEFLMGYEHLQQHRNPRILLYRKMESNSAADVEQQQKVDSFFKQFVGESEDSKFEGIFSEFSALDEFVDAIESHLHQVVRKHVLAAKQHNLVERPEFEEEPRRIDAAIPRQAALGETTMLQVMVCLPDSEGLREQLPETAKDARDAVKDDVRKGTLMVAFPKDPQTGELQSTDLQVEVSTSDFEFADGCSSQSLRLAYKHDSPLLAFELKPLAANERAKITIRVKGPALDGGELLYGTILLQTEITETALQKISGTASRVISQLLGGAFESKRERTFEEESGGDGDSDAELEAPSLGSDDGNEFELALDDAETDGSGASDVIQFDDDDYSATVVKKPSRMEDVEGDPFDMTADSDDDFDLDEDEFDDDMDVDDGVIGEDDELDDLDAFDAEDEEFDDTVFYGESHGEFAPSPRMRGTEFAPHAEEWERGWRPAHVTKMRILVFLLLCVLLLGGLVGLAILNRDQGKSDESGGTKPAARATEMSE